MNEILTAVLVLCGVGLVCSVMLVVAAKFMAVPSDEKQQECEKALPGANCGACGYAGCDAFAQAVVDGAASPNGCTPGGKKTAAAIGAILGVAVEDVNTPVARVRCQGTCENVSARYDYVGLPTCRAAAAMSGGPTQCEFGCLGMGDCLNHCPFHAITIVNGVASIDESLCTGCGTCVATCPRGIISLLPRDRTVVVLCRNKAVGRIARLQCKTACVGCHRCEKSCPSDSIHVVDGVAEINPDTCTRCGACAEVCPMHCIQNLYVPRAEREGMEQEAD